jgi:protein TonB
VSHVLPQRRHERHPVGLLLIIGLHLLLGLAMLSTRLQVDVPPVPRSLLSNVDTPPPPLTPPRELPGAPRATLRPVVVPVPEVVVDRVDAVVASPVEAPPTPTETPQAVATPTAAVPAPISPVVAGQGQGVGVGLATGAGRPQARPARVYADAPQCQPVYPQVARMHHVAGSTRLRFTIDVAGRIVGVRVLGQSGPQAENRVLDSAAAEALSHCPAEVGIDAAGHAVGGTADIDYNWVLY